MGEGVLPPSEGRSEDGGKQRVIYATETVAALRGPLSAGQRETALRE